MRPTGALGWAAAAFAAALPLSIAGANIGWALVAAALLWDWRAGRRPDFAAARGPLWRPLWFFFAATLAADLLGRDPAHSLRYLNQDFHKVWLGALFAVAFAAQRPAPAAFALGAAAAAFIGTAQALSGPHVRAHAFVHPVTYGEQLALLTLGAGAALFAPPPGLEGRRARTLAGALLAACAAALVLSNTRGAVLAAAAGAAAMAATRPRGRRVAGAVLALGAALFVAMELMRADRSILLGAAKALSGEQPLAFDRFMRLTLWDVAWRMGLDHLWTGVGVNNYRTLLPAYFTGVFEDKSLSWGTAHNLYLHHFAERGLLGLAALGLLLWTMVSRAYARVREASGFWNFWAWGATVCFLVMNLTEVVLQTELVWMLLWAVWLSAEGEARRPPA